MKSFIFGLLVASACASHPKAASTPSTPATAQAGSGSDGSAANVSGLGGPCSDDVAVQKKCAAGLTCVMPTSGPISEHTPGSCQAVAGK